MNRKKTKNLLTFKGGDWNPRISIIFPRVTRSNQKKPLKEIGLYLSKFTYKFVSLIELETWSQNLDLYCCKKVLSWWLASMLYLVIWAGVLPLGYFLLGIVEYLIAPEGLTFMLGNWKENREYGLVWPHLWSKVLHTKLSRKIGTAKRHLLELS